MRRVDRERLRRDRAARVAGNMARSVVGTTATIEAAPPACTPPPPQLRVVQTGVRVGKVNAEFERAQRAGLTAAKVLASPLVDGDTAEDRSAACAVCRCATVLSTGVVMCEALDCLGWRNADRRVLNRHEAAGCPRLDPTFSFVWPVPERGQS
jgi:hypothetical protein